MRYIIYDAPSTRITTTLRPLHFCSEDLAVEVDLCRLKNFHHVFTTVPTNGRSKSVAAALKLMKGS